MPVVLKYKVQLTILLMSMLLVAFVLTFYSPVEEIEYFEVFVEWGVAASCLFLMFWVEHLNSGNLSEKFNDIYWLLLVSSSFLFIGHMLDGLDEVSIEIPLLDFLEDIFKPVGFLLFVYANFRWVERYKQQSEAMGRLAEIDSLTGLLNRRAFFEKGNLSLQHSHQNRTPVSVMVIDIDHFKSVNDRFGHKVGDHVLVAITKSIRSRLRKRDYMARLGGEEFVVLLHETDTDEAKRVAEKIRSCVENLKVNCNWHAVSCTVSLGLVTHHAEEDGLEDMVEQADKALYEAKAQGRNCWVTA